MKHFFAFLLFIVCFWTTSAARAQTETFRRVFTHAAYYNPETEEWGDWTRARNTIVFNVNSRGDAVLYMADGRKKTFAIIGEVKKDKTSEGLDYQIVPFVDEDGNEVDIQLFDKGDVKLIHEGGHMFQLSNLEG